MITGSPSRRFQNVRIQTLAPSATADCIRSTQWSAVEWLRLSYATFLPLLGVHRYWRLTWRRFGEAGISLEEIVTYRPGRSEDSIR